MLRMSETWYKKALWQSGVSASNGILQQTWKLLQDFVLLFFPRPSQSVSVKTYPLDCK